MVVFSFLSDSTASERALSAFLVVLVFASWRTRSCFTLWFALRAIMFNTTSASIAAGRAYFFAFVTRFLLI